MICVFDVIEGPARGKRFWLRPNQLMEVGRISTADFSVPTDQHMSRHHLIVEATTNAFRVRDVGSANGTFVNDAKVTTLELCSGDRIRAGVTTLEVSMIADDESPHARDGLSLSQSVAPKDSVVLKQANAPSRPAHVLDKVSDSDETSRFPSIKHLYGSTLEPSFYDNQNTRPVEHWLTVYFSPSQVPNLYWEASDFRSLGLDLCGLLQRLRKDSKLSILINSSQLGRFELNTIEDWLANNRLEKISGSHYLFEGELTDDVWEFLASSQCRDSVICFGTDGPLDREWLKSEVELFRYPSKLATSLQKSSDDQRNRLLRRVNYLVFERDRGGRLGLLCGDFLTQSI